MVAEALIPLCAIDPFRAQLDDQVPQHSMQFIDTLLELIDLFLKISVVAFVFCHGDANYNVCCSVSIAALPALPAGCRVPHFSRPLREGLP